MISISTRSCGIRTGIADKTIVSHWWMNIQTNQHFYQLQFRAYGSQIVLRKCNSSYDCDQCGLAEAVRDNHTEPMDKDSFSKSSVSNKTLGDITNWLEGENFSSHYSLLTNNCQHLCKAVYQWM